MDLSTVKIGGKRICVAGIAFLAMICISCGDQFRPIAIPITPPLPDPQAVHAIFVVSDNGFATVSGQAVNPGGTSRLDVSGDSNVGVAQVGLGPMHAAIPANGSRLYVANSLEDTVSSYSPSNQTAVTTTSLPTGSMPMFLESTETANMYVANYNSNSVGAIVTATNVLASPLINVGTHPVALIETPDGKKLYSVNQGSGDVTPITTSNRSTGMPISIGGSPVWAVARSDSARVYVLDSSSGTLSTINTLTDALVPTNPPVSAGAGANFMFYDKALNRVYIVNPNAANLTIVDVSGDAPRTLTQITVCTGCHPVSVTVLPDGTRAYVGSYMLVTDPANGLPAIEWQIAVINAQSLNLRGTVPADPTLTLFDIDTVNPTGCGSTPFGSSPLPFRVSVAAAGDSSKVMVSSCDSGSTAVIQTSNDTLVSGQSQILLVPAQPASFNPTSITVTAATQNGTSTVYSYVQTLPGPPLRAGMRISITGMQDQGNNGSFSIAALGSANFTVSNPLGVSNSGQNGSGIAVPFQNPVFMLAGP